MSVYKYTDYKKYLRDVLYIRQQKNAQYSSKKFAKDIGLSPARLSEVISKGHVLSLKSADIISEKLGLTKSEKRYFISLVQLQLVKKKADKKTVWRSIVDTQSAHSVPTERQKFSLILNRWYYMPIVEYITSEDKIDLQSLAIKLRLDEKTIVESINELEAHGYISKSINDCWRKTTELLKFESEVPSEIIKKFHQQYLKLASTAIENQSIDRRKFLTSVLRIRKSDVGEIRDKIEAFNQALVKKYSNLRGADSVYTVAMQLYEIEGVCL